MIEQAKIFSINAHSSITHKRKYTNELYYVHPERVAKLVATVTSEAEVIAAAWLHLRLFKPLAQRSEKALHIIAKNRV